MDHAERKKRRHQLAMEVKKGGMPLEVAKQNNVSRHLVYKACQENKVKMPSHRVGPLKKKRWLLVMAEILQTNRSFTTIAKRFQVSNNYVSLLSRNMEEAGIIFPKRTKGNRNREEIVDAENSPVSD